MKSLLAALLLSALCACAPPEASLPESATVPKRPADWVAVDQTLDAYLRAAGGPLVGYAFAVFDRDGVVHRRYGGDYDADTEAWLASATKVPSAAAILTLVDAGRLDLDVPVGRYIAQAGAPILWPADKQRITMRMLLSHTSGLAGHGEAESKCINSSLGLSLRQCAQLIALAPLRFAPGTAFGYGGADYQLAGYVATLIAETDWHRFFRAAIAEPLGLTRFRYGDAERTANPRIAGGAISTLDDYVRIMRMLKNDGVYDQTRVLSAASVQLLMQDQTAGLAAFAPPQLLGRRVAVTGYTLGFWISDPLEHPGSPGPEYSDPGLFGSLSWLDQGLDYGAVVLTADATGAGLRLWSQLRPELIARLRRE